MRLVASVTTIPGRFRLLRRAIRSMLRAYPFEEIRVIIPDSFPRIRNGRKHLRYPRRCINLIRRMGSVVRVVRVKDDLGPGLKFSGASDQLPTVVFDDDVKVRKRKLRQLIAFYARVNRSAGSRAVTCGGQRRLMGVRGIILPPGAVRGYAEYLRSIPKKFRIIDDNTVEVYLIRQGYSLRNAGVRIGDSAGRRAPHALYSQMEKRRRVQRAYALFELTHRGKLDTGPSTSRVLRLLAAKRRGT